MVKVTFFSTSKPVIDKEPDTYTELILNSIKKEMLRLDKNAVISCAAHIENDMVIITGEIEADSSIDASKVVRDTINHLFKKPILSTPRYEKTVVGHSKKRQARQNNLHWHKSSKSSSPVTGTFPQDNFRSEIPLEKN